MAAFHKLSNGSWALKSATYIEKGTVVQVLKADGTPINLLVGNMINTRVRGHTVYEFTQTKLPPGPPPIFRSEICAGCGTPSTRYDDPFKNKRCVFCQIDYSDPKNQRNDAEDDDDRRKFRYPRKGV